MGALSDRTRTVLDRMRRRGVDLVAVTGRPPRWVVGLDLGPGLAICSNGALVIDLGTGDRSWPSTPSPPTPGPRSWPGSAASTPTG